MFHPGLPDKFVNVASILLSKLINRRKKLEKLKIESVLVIRQDEIGDMCYSTHAFSLLKKQYPNAKITVWCKPAAAALIQHDPNIDIIINDDKPEGNKYDLLIDLRGKWAGIFYALLNTPRYRLERGIVRLKNKGHQPHESETIYQIIQPAIGELPFELPQLYASALEFNQATDFINENNLDHFAILHTQVKKQLRQWPEERFAEIAIYLKEKHSLSIVFCGDKSEVAGIERVQKLIPFTTHCSAGKLSLGGFKSLCERASLFIGNDSSPLHIASLSGVPALGLFGPGQSDTFYPLGKKSGLLHHILPCHPCTQVKCKQEIPCMQRISVAEVREKIEEITA
ncbi:MAG: glycosyltransferase family 9 protein [Bacteroidota bacterium]